MGKAIDLTGQKFGKLTAIRATKKRSGPFVVWLCICECGNETNSNSNNLNRGLTKSCGKYQCQSKFIDLSNKKFGKLTAIELINGYKNGRLVWRCKCECGKEKEVRAGSLINSGVRSCGKYQCKSDFLDITEKTFGKLTAIKFLGIVGKSSNWECKCSCGTQINVKIESLMSGNTQSCGCLIKDNQYRTIENRVYRDHCLGAKKRGIQNFLSQGEYLSIVSNVCHYCGNTDTKRNSDTGAILMLNGIDRKNNEPFYTIENSIPCCKLHNGMKMAIPYNDFISIIRKTADYTKNISLDQVASTESVLQNLCSENIPL